MNEYRKTLKEGKYAGFHCGGPEMESVCNLGPRIDTYDVQAVNVMCGLVNDLGMDSISAGAALSWIMEVLKKDIFRRRIREAFLLIG